MAMLLKALILSAALAVPALAAQTGADMGYPPTSPPAAQPGSDMPHAQCPMMKDAMGQHHAMMDGSKGMMAGNGRHAMAANCPASARHPHKKKHRHR